MNSASASSIVPTPSKPGTPDTAGVATSSTEFISFAIGDDQYGVDIMAVREIKGWSGITPWPNQPDYMRGVLNLRGVMMPIIDLRCRFGQGLTEATPVHIVIVVQIDIKSVGLLADRVLDIISLEASQIQAVPRVSDDVRTDFLSGLAALEPAIIALIHLNCLLATTRLSRKADAPVRMVDRSAACGRNFATAFKSEPEKEF
jgi:purine-binding chemotaxis protein CheW